MPVAATSRTLFAVAALFGPGLVTQAAERVPPVSEPQVDLGQTSFLDGEAGLGGLLEIIGNGTAASYLTNANSQSVPGRNQLWSASVTVHPAYLSNTPFLDGHLGAEALVPLVLVHANTGGQPETTVGGVGDITLAPFIQWSGGSLLGQPLSARLALQVVAPVGSYVPGRMVNIGQNAWQLSPYLALTWRVTEHWEVSSRFIYDWSSNNNHPASAFGAGSIRAGDLVETNLSASYAVSERWRIGVAGYALQQIGVAKIGGTSVSGSRQRAFGLGPGFLWDVGGARIIGTAYREFATENRPEGFQGVLRLLQPF